MRQSLASSTAGAHQLARILLELLFKALKQGKGIGGRAGETGDHLALADTANLRALPFTTVWPRLTWPSPAMTTLPPFRTVTIVVM